MQAVIFDMDGVIINSEPTHISLEKTIFRERGILLDIREHLSFMGTNSREMFSQLKARYGFSHSVEELVTEARRRYMELLSSGDLPIVTGIPELVGRLRKARYLLAVASSAPYEQIDLVMERSEMGGHFTVRVSGDDMERSKPDPAIFLKTAEKLKVHPAECWVIEDSENGVTAAREAGMRPIAFINPGTGPQNLSGAEHIVGSISDAGRIIMAEGCGNPRFG